MWWLCEKRHKSVGELNGVEKAVVTLDDGKAVVTFDESAVNISQLIETIEDAGFDATE